MKMLLKMKILQINNDEDDDDNPQPGPDGPPKRASPDALMLPLHTPLYTRFHTTPPRDISLHIRSSTIIIPQEDDDDDDLN